ncbi:hypothetical protein ALP26_104031 [Pseudomonas savastanoi pv. glycinea]|uniref:Uncharacterized protein n=1 Tax=Pseudomonas savastanoi pv. glycinea TaxID=318 RepID=A0A0P9RPN5_PSESG|nr:hypothetical protein PsgB076_13832 [Pseudomonas savastanoi pv. glycinea str. B076]EFW84705.1 hypothetical protein PsgRace4_17788 [Pseudomonas savastanoi pv. glycinea str. race 4]KPX50048.1 hypothetical protein ALO37_103170 [Pseudomonas savastanoi pv. glycinea]PYD21869.1 hypothetical protein DND36_16985 [Pseudomonas savastanoi pv. glycinea]RMM97670.1 hypothetical protein ALQ67_104018 [Pseudomonas savastanoi pv. glycinea]
MKTSDVSNGVIIQIMHSNSALKKNLCSANFFFALKEILKYIRNHSSASLGDGIKDFVRSPADYTRKVI